MIYKNNLTLREYLDRGAAGAYREHLRHPQFELDATAFAAALAEVRAQHPQLAGSEAEARAVFRLLTCGAPPEIAAPLPSAWWRIRAAARAAAALAWPWLKIAWAVALLLLAAITLLLVGAGRAHAAPPDASAIPREQVVRALTDRAAVLAQLGSGGARVQFYNGSSFSYVSSANPLPITCISGCSGGGGGSVTISGTLPAFASTPAVTLSGSWPYSGALGTVSLTGTLPAFAATPAVTVSGTLPAFASTPTVTVGNSSLAVTGTFWQATQPVSNAGTFAVQDAPNGPATPGAAASFSELAGCIQGPGAPSSGQQVALDCDSGGYLMVDIGAGLSGGIKANAVPQSVSTYAAAAFHNKAVTSTTTVKSTGGNLWGWSVYNPNSSLCVLDFYNTTSPTLGTTAPVWSVAVAASGSSAVAPGAIAVANFSSAIAVAAETADTGSTTCTSGMIVSVSYD